MQPGLPPTRAKLVGSRLRRAAVGTLTGIAALSLVAACSNSGSSSSAGSTSAAASGTSSKGLAAARALLRPTSEQPTRLPITQKITKPVPTGKTAAFISCGSPECDQEGAIVKQATDALGWTLSVINTNSTVAGEQSAFQQVVREKLNAVFYSAVSRSAFSQFIPQLEANGTFVAGAFVTDSEGNGINYLDYGPTAVGPVGTLEAAWIADDSNGSGSAVFINIPAFSVLADELTGFTTGMAKYCPSCTSGTLNIPNAAVGQNVPALTVAYLRAHPNVKYVVASADSLVDGLPAAIKGAGLTGIKIIGQAATGTNLVYLHAGQEDASFALDYYYALWALVDAAARHFAGVPQVEFDANTLPHWLLTKDNAPTTNSIFPVVKNLEAQFKALWGVS